MDLIPRDNEENFRAWLSEYLEYNRRLKAVVGDLSKSQRRIVYDESKGSLSYVADGPHLLRLAVEQVQRLRKRLLHEAGVSARTGEMAGLKAAIDTPLGKLSADQRELMAAVRNRWPALWRAVHVKEGVFQFYASPTLSAAEEALRQWISGLSREDRVVFKLFLKSLRDWRTEILNYWRVALPGAEPGGPPRRVTNGAIEARNNQLAICYAASRGWDRGRGKGGPSPDESRGFQRLRTEMLLRYGESNPDED